MTPNASTTRDQYLESSVQTASPAKLRLMLIERAVQVSGQLSQQWREDAQLDDPPPAVNEQSITLLDLFNELLSGVTDKETELGRQVADLYVFLCQHLIKAEQHRDADGVDEIRLVLETEAETWRMVCAQENSGQMSPFGRPVVATSQGGIDFAG